MKLPDYLQEADNIAEELRQMEISEREAKAKIDSVAADEKLSLAEQEQQMMSARIRLDLIPARRRVLEKQLAELNRQMAVEFDGQYRSLRKRVEDAHDAKEREICAALAPFYDAAPDSRPVTRAVASLNIPALRELERLSARVTEFDHPLPPMPERVRRLLNNLQIVARALGPVTAAK